MRIPLRSYWQLLSRYLASQRTSLTLLALLLAARIGLLLALPRVARSFLDQWPLALTTDH